MNVPGEGASGYNTERQEKSQITPILSPPAASEAKQGTGCRDGQTKQVKVGSPEPFRPGVYSRRQREEKRPKLSVDRWKGGRGETHLRRSAGSLRRTQYTVTQPRTETSFHPLQPLPRPTCSCTGGPKSSLLVTGGDRAGGWVDVVTSVNGISVVIVE